MMKTWHKVVALSAAVIATIFLVSCEDKEANALAQAQACMDGISSANYADANACMAYVEGYDSQQANILKCSIKMMSGGLTTEKVAEAYKAIAVTGGAASNEATFITILALSPASAATDAQVFCDRSGLKGLIYLANLAVVGSTMAAVLPPGGYDPTDPTSLPTEAEVNQIINDCAPPANCGGGHAAIGTSVIDISEEYCVGDNATTSICQTVNDAISGAGGDPTLVAKQLFCQLSQPPKTYDSGTDTCI
jgi:hypothetical protein